MDYKITALDRGRSVFCDKGDDCRKVHDKNYRLSEAILCVHHTWLYLMGIEPVLQERWELIPNYIVKKYSLLSVDIFIDDSGNNSEWKKDETE